MVELIWDGKYDASGKRIAPLKIALPFQTVETVNESAQDRQKSLFSLGQQTEWRNRLIWGDKKYVLPSLLPEFAGKVDLIYIDPPFATGANFSFEISIGDDISFEKEASIIEQKAYRDTWGKGLDGYLQWFYETAFMLYNLLKETGSIYIHLDWHVSSYAKVVLDEIFGINNFQNEICWKRATSGSAKSRAKRFGADHDVIFFYTKSSKFTFNPVYGQYPEKEIAKRFKLSDKRGRYKDAELATYSNETLEMLKREDRLIVTSGGKYRYKIYLDEVEGVLVDSVWTDIPNVNSQALERENYPTQKPESLIERIIKASSNENDLILDCFCGSGTTASVSEKLNRRWITCDLGRFSIHTSRKRLLSISNVKPFVVQNLGKYERQIWQRAEFGEETETVIQNYRNFILDLYQAEAIHGYTWLHGVKDGRMVHVGSVDSPVAPADITHIIIEAKNAKIKHIDVLGWDFALDMNETQQQSASEAGVRIKFVRIPREVLEKKAVEQGDIIFYELSSLGVDIKQDGAKIIVKLIDFMVARDDVPDDVFKAVSQWDEWIDYWAIDFNFRDDTFHNEWQSYRTNKKRKLDLSCEYTYPQSGKYTILIKVIDILGNDTTKAVEIEV